MNHNHTPATEQATKTKVYRYNKDKESLLRNMRKVEGQARGITKMIEEGRYCIDIVQQLTALSSAADAVALSILQNHIEGCVVDAVNNENQERILDELMLTIRKAMRR